MTKNQIIKLLASGFYSGYSPIVPGTTGTIPAFLIAFFLIGNHPDFIWIMAIVFTLASVYISGQAEQLWEHDSKKIVIDEWAGMMTALILVPYSLFNFLVAFMVFRGFDTVKFFPADVAERLPRGWGVTADDIVAGIQANILTQLIIYIKMVVIK